MVKHHSLELYEMAYDYAVKACEIEPNDERLKQNLKLIYLGREYMFKCEWLKCIETLKRHLSLKSAVWNDERCASMRWIAHSYYKLGNIKEAYSWYYRAIAEVPHMRDAYGMCKNGL